jgi:hypothetical protein
MSKHFEDLAKNLASGMSRRKAFGQFTMGIGAAVAGLILRRPARAEGIGKFCVDFCRSIGATGAEFGQCVSDCVHGIGVNVNRVG